MKKLIAITYILFALLGHLFSCTIGVANACVTENHKPLLWKSRDINPNTTNTLRFVDNLNYKFVGVTSPEENRMWMGVNENGFALANSLANDLTVAEGDFNNGNLIYNALGTIANLSEFENYLDYLTNSTLNLELRGNFVAFDSTGTSKLYEINNSNYWVFDASENTSPFRLRTNHSVNGGGLDGIVRLVRSTQIIEELIAEDNLNVNSILTKHIRDLSDNNSQAYELPWGYGDPTPLIDTSFSINRQSTISAVVIEGIEEGESPEFTTMWLIMGNPFTSYALPLFPFLRQNNSIFNQLSENSPELVAHLWIDSSNNIIDTHRFISPSFSLLEELKEKEEELYEEIEELKEDLYDNLITDESMISFINQEASNALIFSTDLFYHFTPNNSPEILPITDIKAFPNPFNNEVTITLSNKRNKNPKLKVYNLKGQLVKELISINNMNYKWDGKDNEQNNLPSGIYFISYKDDNNHYVKKLLLMN